MKTAQEIKNEFEQILAEVIKINGLTEEKAVDVALTLIQESGKNSRTAVMNEAKVNGSERYSNGNGNQPATERQKEALGKFGISYSNSITKVEASRLLDEAIAKANGKGRGRKPASSFSF